MSSKNQTSIKNIQPEGIKIFDTSFCIFITIFSVLIGLICFFPAWLTSPAINQNLNFTNTGEIGDTIGGIMGPFIAIVAALLTFIAFWVQYKANLQQTGQFKAQARDVAIERFENKFYELLKIHRENINEFNIEDKLLGRKTFVHMFNELRFCYNLAASMFERDFSNVKSKRLLDREQIFNISYLTFFFGIGQISNNAYKDLMKKFNSQFIDEFHKLLIEWQDVYLNKTKTLRIPTEFGGVCEVKFKYKPFEGHISRLGHYNRHLFQAIKFVVEQDDLIISNKYEYVKTLRAQLSAHEQLLLYYNSLSILGKPWLDLNLLKTYRFIKNIPLPYADFYITPKEKFGELNANNEKLFEWDEIIERL